MEDDDNSKDRRKKVKTKTGKTVGEKSGGKAWLHEGDSEEIMDFMDINAAKKVMGKS